MIKSETFHYCKVGRAISITTWGRIDKIPILILTLQCYKMNILMGHKKYLRFPSIVDYQKHNQNNKKGLDLYK